MALWPNSGFSLKSGEGRELAGLVIGAVALCLTGAWDDVRGLRASLKLAAQTGAAAVAFGFGFRIEAIQLPFIGPMSMGVFAFPVTVVWIVGVTNAVNLIDGLDGLAAGVSFFAALTAFVIASLSGSAFVALLMAALMGALVGFLFFNFNPARIFMGDSGSYFLGFVLATTSLGGALQQKASTAVSLLVPILALGLPIFDTLFSMFRRVIERRPIFAGDRGHIHHRLLDLGLTHRRAVIFLYGVSLILAGGAIAVSLGRRWQIGVALLAVTMVFVGLVRFVGYFDYLHFQRRQKARLRDSVTESLRKLVPELLVAGRHVRSEEATFELIERLTRESSVPHVELCVGAATVRQWSPTGTRETARDWVEVSFPIGADEVATSKLKFSWPSETDHASPQADVLLQIFVDQLATTLERVGSQHAPAPRVSVSMADDESAVPSLVRNS
jgi:UDP-GlcNAc:undecaprenyl-phosphate GlcNAc-1-phosphate transferase